MCVQKGDFSRHKAKLKRCQGEPRRTPDTPSLRTEPHSQQAMPRRGYRFIENDVHAFHYP